MKGLTKEQLDALENAKPKPPNVHELGGGIYYTCYWLACGENLKRWYNYCPKCGSRILWGDKNDV